MSLTTHLRDKDSPVRQFLYQELPNTRRLLMESRRHMDWEQTIRPEGTVNWTAIGTAIDYRLRYYFEVTPWQRLVASQGAQYLQSFLVATGGEVDLVHRDFFRQLETTTTRFEPPRRRLPPADEDALNRYCYALALLDVAVRAGPEAASEIAGASTSVEAMLSCASSCALSDLRNLSYRFYDRHNHLTQLASELNPTFDGSFAIGGADADLVVDDTLIDIKTTVKLELQSTWVYELMGYALLDYSDAHRLDSIGLYLARQGVLLKWDLRSAIRHLRLDKPGTLEELRRGMRQTVLSQKS